VPKAKAMRPLVEKMITLASVAICRRAARPGLYLDDECRVDKLFDTIRSPFGDRDGGYLRIVRVGWRKGDGADTAFVELLGSEKLQEEKREKRAVVRSKRAEEAKRRWKKLRRSRESSIPPTTPKAPTRSKTRKSNESDGSGGPSPRSTLAHPIRTCPLASIRGNLVLA